MPDQNDNSNPETHLREISAARVGDDSLSATRPVPAADRPVAATRVIDGRYVLEQCLGGGGMGVVYRALDTLLAESQDPDPYVAIKLISEEIRQSPEAALALQREARRSQALTHPNIVKVFHFGRDGDSYYLTMELLRGRSLEQLIRDHPTGLPLAKALPLIEQICAGLAHAHAERIVHSDIKPGNIFLTDTGVVKILDFGIASPLRAQDSGARETLFNPRRLGAISPSYSSVEMWLGMDADPRDDVYSAACVIYELLSGVHPFDRVEAPRALERNLVVSPIRNLNRAQNAALLRALSLKAQERTASIPKFAQQLLGKKARPIKRTVASAVMLVVTAAVFAAASYWATIEPSSPIRQPEEDSQVAIPQQTVGPALVEPAPRTTPGKPTAEVQVAWRGAGACPDLESNWQSRSCQQRRECFSQRANDAAVARSVAPRDLEPIYAARVSLYQALVEADCENMEAQRDQAYAEFRREFPNQTVD